MYIFGISDIYNFIASILVKADPGTANEIAALDKIFGINDRLF